MTQRIAARADESYMDDTRTTFAVAIVQENVSGYVRLVDNHPTAESAAEHAADVNRQLGLSAADADAIYLSSLCAPWPADPDHWSHRPEYRAELNR